MKTASEIVVAIERLHPRERALLREFLSVHGAPTSALLEEIEGRYDEFIDYGVIVAMAKRIVEAETEFATSTSSAAGTRKLDG